MWLDTPAQGRLLGWGGGQWPGDGRRPWCWGNGVQGILGELGKERWKKEAEGERDGGKRPNEW